MDDRPLKSMPRGKRFFFQNNDKKCIYCFIPLTADTGTIDHFYPKAYRREHNVPSPLYCCCKTCNTLKADYVFDTIDDVRQFIQDECRNILQRIREQTQVGLPDA